MKIYRFERDHRLPVPIADAWDYFSNPANLRDITPPELTLTVTSDLPPRMYQGMLITYTVTPLLGIRMSWVTEITSVDEPYLFVDEQRFGPYRFWHHQHRFEPVEGGVRMTDTVHYGLPLGILGRIGNAVSVRRNLDRIFAYRQGVLDAKFGSLPIHRHPERDTVTPTP